MVTVTAAPTSGSISGTSSVGIGSTSQLSISGNSAAGTWDSSDDAVATVNSSGLVTGQAAGSVNITYTVSGSGGCSNATDTYAMTVTNSIATTGNSSNWNDVNSWASGALPTAGQSVVISHDMTVNANTAERRLTIDASKTLTVGAFIKVSGLTDVNGTLSLGASAVANIDGEYDATSGNTTYGCRNFSDCNKFRTFANKLIVLLMRWCR